MRARNWALIALLAVLTVPVSGWTAVYTFTDKDFYGGASWGTMTIGQEGVAANQIAIRFDFLPTSTDIVRGEVTGFGFSFEGAVPVSISNPYPAGSRLDLDWTVLDKNSPNALFPGVANGDEFDPAITSNDFMFGATEGDASNFTPPGIGIGQFDVFYLNFAQNVTEDDVILTGIRLQGIDGEVNEGSLFLAGRTPGTPVSEPGTLMLLGSGLVSLAVMGRRYRRG